MGKPGPCDGPRAGVTSRIDAKMFSLGFEQGGGGGLRSHHLPPRGLAVRIHNRVDDLGSG